MTPRDSHMRQNIRGFTLVEVLVALGLIGLAALAMMKVAQEGASVTGAVRERFFAGVAAENRLIETMSDPQAPDAGVSRGRSVIAGQDWAWTQTVSPTSDPAILRIEITVSRSEAGPVLADLQAFRGAR